MLSNKISLCSYQYEFMTLSLFEQSDSYSSFYGTQMLIFDVTKASHGHHNEKHKPKYSYLKA
jgi:hypothetical protein